MSKTDQIKFKISTITSCVLLTFSSVFGQIENIYIDKRTNIDKIYAGLYSKLEASTDSFAFEDKVSFRVGARATHKLNSIFSVNAQAAMQIENNKEPLPIMAYTLITRVTSRVQLRAGSFPTPNTLFRPDPITWQGQTESYSQSRIVAARPGALLAYSVNGNQSINLGYHYQNDQWASHASVDLGNFGLAGWVQNDGEYFGLIDYQNKEIKTTLNYSSNRDEYTNSLFYSISEQYSVYSDINYRTDLKKTEVFRLGVRSYFENKAVHLKGFIALQYDFYTHLASLQFLIHLH